jgi:hypothetical protein
MYLLALMDQDVRLSQVPLEILHACLQTAEFNLILLPRQRYWDRPLPKPIILTDVHLTTEKFSNYLERKVEDLIPYYLHRENTLVTPKNYKLDSLAHELVHYFQVMYRKENLELNCGPYIENIEMEALEIQRWFKSKYLES